MEGSVYQYRSTMSLLRRTCFWICCNVLSVDQHNIFTIKEGNYYFATIELKEITPSYKRKLTLVVCNK
jgi:hypothetical protein